MLFRTVSEVVLLRLFLFGAVVFFAQMSVPAPVCASDPESLFIDACLNSGYNPKKFQTMQASFQMTVQSGGEPEALEQILPQEEESFRANYQGPKEELESAWASSRELVIRLFAASVKREQISCIVKGTYYVLGRNIKHHTPDHFRQRLYHVLETPETGAKLEPIQVLMHSSFESPISYFKASLPTNGAVLDINTNTITSAEIQLFGRIQGYWAEMAIDTLLAGSNYKSFSFSHAGRKAFADACQREGVTFANGGEKEYDGGHKATVVIVHKEYGDVHYWIDASRGFICPVIQYFMLDSNSVYIEHIASDFILNQPTGLWYPQKHRETAYRYRSGTQEIQRQVEFVLEPETLQINKPVADAMFVLDVRQGLNIWDNREGHDGQYRASAAGQLSFKGGKFNIDDIDWIDEDEVMYHQKPVPISQSMSLFRSVLIATGSLMVITALFLICRKYAKRASQKRDDDEK